MVCVMHRVVYGMKLKSGFEVIQMSLE